MKSGKTHEIREKLAFRIFFWQIQSSSKKKMDKRPIKTRLLAEFMPKKFSVSFSYLVALVLAVPLELSAYWDYEWIKNSDDVWESFWSDPAGHGYSPLLCRYGEEDRPVAVLRCPIIQAGESFFYPCAPEDWATPQRGQTGRTYEEYLCRFSGYFLLREEIKEWLWRLGIVEEGSGRIAFRRNLSVSYVIHHQPEGFGDKFRTTWHCWDPNKPAHPVAIRFIRLSEAQINWVREADQMALRPVRPSTASLPNGFFKREFPQEAPRLATPQTNAEVTSWWETRITGDVDFDRSGKDAATNFPQTFSFAALIVQPGGDVEVIIETFFNQSDFDMYLQSQRSTPDETRTEEAEPVDPKQRIQDWLEAILAPLCVSESIEELHNFYTATSQQAFFTAMRAENEEETDDFPKGTKDYIIKYGIIKTGQIADIQFLLSHGLDVNTLLEKDEENAKQSLLSWAAGCRQREMARILLSKGADPFLFPRNSTDPERAAGASAMGSAIWGNDTKIAEYILGQRPLQQNINLSIKDIDGRQWSLLYLAIYKNSPEMVALLLRHGASAKEALLTDAAGKKWTPLQYASGEEITVWDEDPEAPGIYKQDQLKTERLSFPDPSDEDDEGEQAAKRADQAKNQAIQRLLREHGGR